ncbi:MAG TPA: SGNH/GDSL hydrolase family protein [Ktedonobacterales bacterium]|nr:SGNH/GDSL hydrolase family protein [Ktedonobacterales bacterium]
MSILTFATLLVACGPSPRPAAAVYQLASSQRDLTYVAIGASDAFGVGTDDPAKDNWPAVLAHLLGSDTHLINLGIPGETVAEARRTELPVAIDARPSLVTVWLGVNDIVQSVSAQEYELQLEALLSSLQQQTHAHVFVGNIPDLTLLSFFAGYDQTTLQATISAWNAAIAQAVAATGASLVDLYAGWNELAAHPEYIAGDGLHPSTEGAKRLAEVFFSQIKPLIPALLATTGAP